MPDPSQTQGPFETLALPARFDLPAGEIERAYLARVAALHPDLASSDPESVTRAARASAALNNARSVLTDAERRANALLALLGGPTKGEDRSLPDGFLLEILEVREKVEAARDSGDPELIDRWNAWSDLERARYTRLASELFSALCDPPQPERLIEIRTQLNAWRYIERLIEQLDPEYDPARADFADGA